MKQLLVLAAAMLTAGAALAQPVYLAKAIKFVVPFAVGLKGQ